MYLPRSLISHLYNHLLRTHHPLSPPVIVLAALEPDALCACRILTSLFKRDYIPHKIQPVSGYADLAKAGNDIIQPMKRNAGGSGGVVVCLGVGGLVDLGELLGLEDADSAEEEISGIEVWVIDARRPWNLTNVFGGVRTATPLGELDANARRKKAGVDKGCIQRGYRPGDGGIVVFDDGDIVDEMEAERDAYCALADMPEVEDVDDSDDDQSEIDSTSPSRKRKSWSDQENEDPEGDDDDERPRQRRRSNSGSSISSNRSRAPSQRTSTSPSPNVPTTKPQSAKVLRRRLQELRRSHESVLQQYYSTGMSYSEPISSLVYSLASELGREDNDLLWLTTVGVTSLELSGHTSTGLGTPHTLSNDSHNQRHHSWRTNRSSRLYALLRDEVRRLNPPPHDSSPSLSPSTTTSSPSDTSIRLTPDPRFLLLRHWSLYDSMLHSPYLASRLHVWNESGVKRLHKLLAKMGVSLNQSKQGYTHMDMELKKSLRDRLLKYAGVYGLDDLVPAGTGRASYEQEGWGFIRSWGWKAQLSAVDVGFILSAILDVGTNPGPLLNRNNNNSNNGSQPSDTEEVPDRTEALLPRFFRAYDALAPSHPTQLLASIPLAQHLLRSILQTGSSLLAKHQIRHLRAFRMGVVKDGPDLELFANSPGALVKLALWVGEAVAVSEREKKSSDTTATPLVLAALDAPRGVYVVVGIGGGIGSGVDIEARREKAELKTKRQEAREQKKKINEEKKVAKQAEREARRAARQQKSQDDDDNDAGNESDESEEEESENDSDESSDDDETADDSKDHDAQKRRGQGNNRFGIAFQEVVEETNARVKIDSFDHCVVEVKKEDLGGFLEGLSLKSVVGR